MDRPANVIDRLNNHRSVAAMSAKQRGIKAGSGSAIPLIKHPRMRVPDRPLARATSTIADRRFPTTFRSSASGGDRLRDDNYAG